MTAERTETPTGTPKRTSGARGAAVAGLIGGIAGLAVAELVSWAVAALGSPLAAAGQWVISVLPASMLNFGKDTLGTADKPILIALVGVVVLIVAVLAGLAEYRRAASGLIVYVLLAAVGLFTVSTQQGVTWNAYLPTVIGLGVGYLILWFLISRLRYWLPARRDAEPGTDYDRRSFLLMSGTLGGLSVIGLIGGRMLTSAKAAVVTARNRIALPTPTSTETIPAGADLNLDGLSPYVVPNDDFYRIDTALSVPVVNPDTWELKVTGMVDNPISISFADLLAKPMVEHVATLTCVSNEVGGNLIGNARWLGYPLRDFLAEAKPQAGADMLLSRSVDGFSAGSPLSVVMEEDRQSLIAVGMNGTPLPAEHGFPARLVVPGLYGYVSATKWVTELKVTTFDADQGYWTPLGWSALGPIKLESRIEVPASNSVQAGTVTVAGVAWDQHVGISKVEVQVDSGNWNTAELAPVTGPDTWRQWSWAWPATSGQHTLTVRATNANGEVQTSALAQPAPNGASGWHQISVDVD